MERNVWKKEWSSDSLRDAKKVFGHRLFIEGYPIIRKYLKDTGPRVFEIGAGTGRYGLQIARDFPQKHVVITDILEESLDVAHTLAEKIGVDNVEFKREDALNISFPDNTFDLVVADVVVQHIPNDLQAVKEMARVLKPKCRLIITANNFWNIHTLIKKFEGKRYKYDYEKSYRKRELRKLLQESGLKIVAEDGFYPAYGIYRHKDKGRIFGWLGRALNRLNKFIDRTSGRFISRHFGFEHVIVGRK